MKEVTFEGNELLIPEDHHYIARDKDGQVFSYPSKPEVDNYWDGWFTTGFQYHLTNEEVKGEDPHWSDSLVEYD